MAEPALKPSIFSIPAHRSFADSLAAGLVRRFGDGPLALATGRILLPNARAVRTITEAFVRASGGGLVLPRLIAIGDPELDDRIGGALDPAGAEPIPPAIDPLERQLALAALIRQPGESAAEAMRLAADLARAFDQLIVEEVAPSRLAEVAADRPELAGHWQSSLDRLQAILALWPAELARRGVIDLAERRNRLLRGVARRWRESPPPEFTVAAGITSSVPAVAELLKTVAFMADGMVVLPGLASPAAMPEAEWDALGPEEDERGEESHPQFHLKRLLDRIGVARGEVEMWRSSGRAASPAARSRGVVNAMASARFSDKWNGLPPAERRLSGVRAAEFADPAGEALGIAIAIREALETPARTVALVTPDRTLAARVSGHLERWGIAADDSAGKPLAQTPPGTLLLAAAALAAEEFAPVPLLALLKHPLAGADDRLAWLGDVRQLDLALRGPRPPAGLDGLDRHFAGGRAERAWARIRPALEPLARLSAPADLASLCAGLVAFLSPLTAERIWAGADGRALADLVARLQSGAPAALAMDETEWLPVLRLLLDQVAVRPPFGGHPRVAILGLIEARLQQADLMILGGLNEGVWPALPAPDPWLAPMVRSLLGLPGLEFRVGLAAHDFAEALGAPSVLVTRARRDSRAPTIASRLWLRLEAMTGGLPRARRIEQFAAAIDDPGRLAPVSRPEPAPPAADRPRTIRVTDVDRLKADPFAFYAKTMLRLRPLEPVDADQSAAWKGNAVHKVLEQWFVDGRCDPDDLLPRARALIAGEAIHPMLRTLWQPRLLEAIDWIAGEEAANQAAGRTPVAAEKKGATTIGGVRLEGRADRIDSLPGGGLAIVDYKTGQPPKPGTITEGFALQLGLLGLIARDGGFEGVGGTPMAHEYWSLAKKNGQFGFRQAPDLKIGSEMFLESTLRHFLAAAAAWLTGDAPFTAKLHPAFAPYGDYDQLMRLDEWYGREERPSASAS
ncbi:PD-(D/E)XK nuclease family protein [Sphingomonas mesophila]|uniref:PD-(D/E)XK nuclease family protein n=1 Tax=Sphingomonas mesophila TaxID=2303576 RepID=UPI000E57C8C2|nr:PD-(D/E)XK nuclease family protein [Sphingomonas mesophila]